MKLHPVVFGPIFVRPKVVVDRCEPGVRAYRDLFVWVRMDQYKEHGEKLSPRYRLNGSRQPAVNAPITDQARSEMGHPNPATAKGWDAAKLTARAICVKEPAVHKQDRHQPDPTYGVAIRPGVGRAPERQGAARAAISMGTP